MSRLQICLAVIGVILIALGAGWIGRAALPERQLIVSAAGCRAPTTVLEPSRGEATVGAAMVVHGLAANRLVMKNLGARFAANGFRVYIPDLAGHGDNSDSFSFARADQCFDATVDSLLRSEHLDPTKTVVVGHSMGGEFAVRLADKIPVAATIAISPAPMVPPRRLPANLLVFSAQFDLWPLADQAAALQQSAGGDRVTDEDFRQRRAFLLLRVPLATHTSMLDDARVIAQELQWADKALGVDASRRATHKAKAAAGLGYGSLLGFFGIAMAMPFAISLAAKLAGSGIDVKGASAPARLLLLAEGGVASLSAVVLLTFGVPLRFLHIYAGDYLISALLIVSITVLALNGRSTRHAWNFRPRAMVAAAALAFTLTLAVGAWANWQTADLWLNAARWVRFWALWPFLIMISVAEETFLGPVFERKARAARFALFLGVRAALMLAILLAYFELSSGQALVPFLVVPLAGFSIVQRLAADALRTRTGDALGAAVFDAILAAWFIAAVFPIT